LPRSSVRQAWCRNSFLECVNRVKPAVLAELRDAVLPLYPKAALDDPLKLDGHRFRESRRAVHNAIAAWMGEHNLNATWVFTSARDLVAVWAGPRGVKRFEDGWRAAPVTVEYRSPIPLDEPSPPKWDPFLDSEADYRKRINAYIQERKEQALEAGGELEIWPEDRDLERAAQYQVLGHSVERIAGLHEARAALRDARSRASAKGSVGSDLEQADRKMRRANALAVTIRAKNKAILADLQLKKRSPLRPGRPRRNTKDS
jgi:hypothetical protein